MKLIDALNAGYTIIRCKGTPIHSYKVDLIQGVVSVHFDGKRDEYFSTHFKVPSNTLELGSFLPFNEDTAAALLMPAGVAPLSGQELLPNELNTLMNQSAEHRDMLIKRRENRASSIFRSDSTASEVAEEKLKEAIAQTGMWTRPKNVF